MSPVPLLHGESLTTNRTSVASHQNDPECKQILFCFFSNRDSKCRYISRVTLNTDAELSINSNQHPSIRDIFNKIALCLGSLHLSLMSSLGIWLWRDPSVFGTVSTCAIDDASIVILGKSFPLGSHILRVLSLAIYSLLLSPGFNLCIPVGFFLPIFDQYYARLESRKLSLHDTLSQARRPTSTPRDQRTPYTIIKSYFRIPAAVDHPRISTILEIFPTIIGMMHQYHIHDQY